MDFFELLTLDSKVESHKIITLLTQLEFLKENFNRLGLDFDSEVKPFKNQS